MKFLFNKEIFRHLRIITVTLKEILLTIVMLNINFLQTDLVSKNTAVQFGRLKVSFSLYKTLKNGNITNVLKANSLLKNTLIKLIRKLTKIF